jgi:hypothetical protein
MMSITSSTRMTTFTRGALAAIAACALWSLQPGPVHADSGPQVKFDASAARPRSVEDETQQAVVRDYARAWNDLGRAFEFSNAGILDGYFVSTARSQLGREVNDQVRAKVVVHYSSQDHDVKAAFYSPEGDVLELHDSVRLAVRLTDGDKTVVERNESRNYVVLMTPGADRWVVRQLQQVQQF